MADFAGYDGEYTITGTPPDSETYEYAEVAAEDTDGNPVTPFMCIIGGIWPCVTKMRPVPPPYGTQPVPPPFSTKIPPVIRRVRRPYD